MDLIDKDFLDRLTERAESNVRLRMNHNFHDSLDAHVQRLLNAMEPGSVFPVHRHRHAAETYVLLRGKVRVFLYDDHGQQTDSFLLDPATGNYGGHIPKGQWHTVEVLAPGTVIFEVKEGPYQPLGPEDILDVEA